MTLAMPAFWVWSQKTFQMMKYTSWKHYKSLRIKLSVKCINGKKGSNPIFAYSHLSYYKKRKWLRDSNFSGSFLPLNGTLVVVSIFGGCGFFIFSLCQSACLAVFLLQKEVFAIPAWSSSRSPPSLRGALFLFYFPKPDLSPLHKMAVELVTQPLGSPYLTA